GRLALRGLAFEHRRVHGLAVRPVRVDEHLQARAHDLDARDEVALVRLEPRRGDDCAHGSTTCGLSNLPSAPTVSGLSTPSTARRVTYVPVATPANGTTTVVVATVAGGSPFPSGAVKA